MTIDQIDYAKKVVQRFGQENCHNVATPLPGGYKPEPQKPLDENGKPNPNYKKATPQDIHQYQSIIGSLLYLTLGTRPDIAYAVILMSQYMVDPSKEHINKSLHIVKYVKSTINAKIVYNKGEREGLVGYADADWGSCKDTGKSITAYLIKLAGAPVSWVSRKQKTVALSSTEAEYMSMTDAIKQIAWMKSLYGELGFTVNNIELNIDNQGAIFNAQNNVVETKTKHINIKYHYVRENVKDQTVHLLYIHTNEQQADILTKNLPRVKFEELRSLIGIQIPLITQRGSVLKL